MQSRNTAEKKAASDPVSRCLIGRHNGSQAATAGVLRRPLTRDSGFTKGVATLDLIAPGNTTARTPEMHKLLFHVLCEIVERDLPKK